MSAVIKFPKLAPDTTRRQGCSVVDNRRNGFILLYKSLKDVPFYRDPVRKSLWLHLLLEAAHERTVDTFNGNRVTLSRGQLVGSARSLGEACGVSEDSARRSLDAFERDGMITRTSKQGAHGYTLVTLLNYDAYQRGVTEHNGAELGAEFKAAPDIGLQVVSQPDGAELGAELHAEALNNINNKTIKDLKDSSSEIAEAIPDNHDLEISPSARKPDAAVQTANGKHWGTQDDLTCAEYIFGKVQQVNPTAKPPNWPKWANDIRLMREQDKRSHRDICELFKWANTDSFWRVNILSPGTLRDKWDSLQAKRLNAKTIPQTNATFDLSEHMTAERLNAMLKEGF